MRCRGPDLPRPVRPGGGSLVGAHYVAVSTLKDLRLDGSVDTHAVIVVDTAGVITSWDGGATEMFGYAATIVGQPVDVIVPEHLREAHWAGFHRAMAAPEIKDMAADLPVLCADGQIREFPGRLLALSDGLGTAIGAIAIYRASGTTGVRPFSKSS